MIYDKMANLANYEGISVNLNNALNLLKTLDVKSLKPGKNIIDDEALFVMMFDYTSIDESEAVYESHKKYIDIQLVLKGNELIRYCSGNLPNVTKPYDKEGDVELYELSEGLDFLLELGTFALFMPGEIHAPKIKTSEFSDVTKIVVKIIV